MKKLIVLAFIFNTALITALSAQVVWEASFTGQSNFNNPTGWDNIDGFTTWNVYPNHGNPSYGIVRSFNTNQADSIKSPASDLISVPENGILEVDVRVMAFSLYPSSFATLTATGEFAIRATDGVTTSTIVTMNAANQNIDTNWITLSGSLQEFAGSEIRLIVAGKSGTQPVNEAYFIDVDNIKVLDGSSVGIRAFDENTIRIFPNPTQRELQISGLSGVANISIIDVTGQVVHTLQCNNHSSATIDISVLSAGIYFATFNNSAGKKTMRFVKSN